MPSSSPPSSSGVLDYLRSSLPRSTLLELYTDDRGRFVCRAVLQQQLSEVAQQVVMRLLYCGGSFPASTCQVWTKLQPAEWKLLLHQLFVWAIIMEDVHTMQASSRASMQLTPEFAKALQACITSLESSPWQPIAQSQWMAIASDASSVLPATPEDLERYTQSQWDAVLHFLVGTPNYPNEPPPAVVHFLLQTGLMQNDPDYRGRDESQAPLVITQKGYDFMLQDVQHQVWHFVSQYLKSFETHKKHKELTQEALLFLICLSFARVGDAYLASSLNKDGRTLMKDLTLFGLVKVEKIGKTTVFYPTRVALQLCTTSDDRTVSSMWTLSSKALEASLAHPRPHDSSHLAVIVQTNFQMCAYTTSELHVSMLGLFCDVHTIRRLPNVVFMMMTRDSIKSAFALGIEAAQILKFLEQHAHPKLRHNVGVHGTVPPNVQDQILLWDRERHLIQWTDVYEHKCLMKDEYRAVRQYALDRGAHAWSSDRRQQLYLDREHAERIEQFARQWRAKASALQAEAEG